MVAKTIILPNIRKLFIPDPGHFLCEVDLSGADAQVVAWEAGDEDLKSAFKAGLKIHMKNARDIYPERCKGWSDEALKATDHAGGFYHDLKQMVHATNYVGSAKTIATSLKWLIIDIEDFQYRWFGLHPKIKEWHKRVAENLAGKNGHPQRTVFNTFGYRIVYFDRVEVLLPKALAWLGQSTVAICADRGGLQVRRKFSFVQFLLQVHDSWLSQIPEEKEYYLPQIHKEFHVTVPYKDPLVIPWGIKHTRGNWGEIS